MTPDPPDEALHFRGKTLTPESPRPLHIPEPANIPVLENQMDPVFNDTSTYDRSDAPQVSFPTLHTQDGWSAAPGGEGVGPGSSQDAGSLHGPQSGNPAMNDLSVSGDSYSSIPAGTAQASNMNAGISLPNAKPSHAPPVVPGSQGFATMGAIDNAGNPVGLSTFPGRLDEDSKGNHDTTATTAAGTEMESNSGAGATGVNFQTLLDNLSHRSATATTGAAPSLEEGSSLHQATQDESLQPSLSSAQDTQSLNHPRPPLHPSNQPPNYHDDSAYHLLPPAQNPAYATTASNQAHQSFPSMPSGGPPGAGSGVGALPPPPVASFQQNNSSSGAESQTSQEAPAQTAKKGRPDKPAARPGKGADDDSPWGPEVQKKYDEFLHDERVYVTEGLWDRFPVGSRLFVGNLPTERVTKRDMFHLFHKYGKLAQISIKQAYGFIQFLEAGACHAALQAEQGALVRGRKIHLEISKPQRSTRPGPAEPVRAPPPRRSRSPEFSRAGPARSSARAPGDRFDRPHEAARLPFSDFRDEPSSHRRRDDYRPPRSPSPRPFRRDGYRSRDRTPERLDRRDRRRSRSPPAPRDLLPRRAPRDVPEVQVLVLEEVDRNFTLHVENAFRNRGLRVDVLVLGPRITLGAAVQRQYVEGVLAVVRLSRPNQFSRKIPLQIFDRSAGPTNVRFSDYPELDPNLAAELMFHQAQAMQRGPAPASFAPNPAFGVPHLPPMPMPQPSMPQPAMPQPAMPALSNPPNIANLIGSMDGPSLQSLLSALQQRPNPQSQPGSAAQSPFSSPNPPPHADLASLLTNANRPPPVPPPPQQPFLHPPFAIHPQNPPMVSDPNLLSLLAKGLGGQPPHGQAPAGSNVQNIMNQLAKWKQ
ncbi:hypothetical protein N7532_004238 [Penicillium argentinense]|uniref:RRM domain-containing protein n=1 Tax=Penicillium argentinense TaxID=1131581 RepID=A0A9W9KEQ6_9EURO|nr:uncharacterized protein N7532_004238 [Penicillium argentinense]KAJ5103709.1 hypothetical protein N7532_004238 [Penicillium argentinense]